MTTNSYGDSAVDNDGFDAASQEADIWHSGSRTTPFFSTGNGAPGYGTTAPPSPFSGIKVGASTQFGGTGWDSIANESQIVDNDVMVWSNRGPGATGAPRRRRRRRRRFLARATHAQHRPRRPSRLGDLGRHEPLGPGGTAAATALVYQAYRSTHPGPVPANFWNRSKEILKSSADDLGYDSWTQGAGSRRRRRAVQLAAGAAGATVSPSEWRAGRLPRHRVRRLHAHDVAGRERLPDLRHRRPGHAGTSPTAILTKTYSETADFTSEPLAEESEYNFNAPDYLMNISDLVQAAIRTPT